MDTALVMPHANELIVFNDIIIFFSSFQNSRCLHYLCNYSGIFGVLQHIHFSSWPSVTFNKKVQDDNNYLNNLLSVVCGTSCMDHGEYIMHFNCHC